MCVSFPPLPPSAHLPCAGLSSSSVQWGAWASIGMVADNAAVHRAMQRSGVGMLQPCQGLAAMQHLLVAATGQAVAQLAAIPFVWQRFMQQQRNANAFFYGEHRVEEVQHRPQLALLGGSHPATKQHSAAAAPPLEQLLQQVLAALAAVHGSSIDPQQPLVQAGFDSLGEYLLGGCIIDAWLQVCLLIENQLRPMVMPPTMQALWSCATPCSISWACSCLAPWCLTTPQQLPWRLTATSSSQPRPQLPVHSQLAQPWQRRVLA